MNNKFLLGVTLVAASLCSNAYATAISSESDASLTGATLVDFESGPTGTFVSQSFGGLGIAAQNTAYATSATFSVDGDFAGNYNTRGRYHITNYGTSFQQLRFDFGGATSAFGFLFGASDSTWVLSAYNAGGLLESLNIGAVYASNAGDFFGLSNLAGATYAILTQLQDGYYSGGGVDYVFVDNFRYVAGNSVPEPTPMALLALGLVGLAVTRRRSAR